MRFIYLVLILILFTPAIALSEPSIYKRDIKNITGLTIPKDFTLSKKEYPSIKIKVNQSLPDEFDWRKHKTLVAVKDQGSCGSCWAMATVSAFEDVYKIVYGEEKNWSEQYLLSCNMDGYSCSGGWWAHQYHKDKLVGGSVAETQFPYTASDSSCKQGLTKDKSLVAYKYIDPSSSDDHPTLPSVDMIKTAIYEYGAVAAAVYVDSAFQNYRGGVFTSCSQQSPNHAITLIGWGKDPVIKQEYWILKNSWGASWGEQGYMKIKTGCSNVGFSANVVELDKKPSHDVEPTPDPDPIYPDDDQCEKITDPDGDPDPEPNPDPEPTPDPSPCEPQPYANAWPDNLPDPRSSYRGIVIGTPRRDGHSYMWADHVGRRIGSSALQYVRPWFTTTYRVYVKTKCGESSDAVTVGGIFRVGNFDFYKNEEPHKIYFAPENEAHKQDNLHKSRSGITEAEFNESMNQVRNIYAPIIKNHRAELRLSGNWNDPTVNAYTTRVGSNWIVQMFGGLARREEVTLDGFKLVICHELGHNLGGYPLMSSMMWPAAEGQSDYFASYACGRLLWGKEDNRGFRDLIPEYPKKLCDEAFKCSRDKDLCYRTMLASWSINSLLATLGGTTIGWDTPDPTVVTSINPNHPNAQCRLDTMMAGNICTAKRWKHEVIPISETQSLKYMCGSYSKGNARPKCWYKPIAE